MIQIFVGFILPGQRKIGAHQSQNNISTVLQLM